MAANSLGVLTLDLVARIGGFVDPLRRAEQESSSSFGKMREGINKYGAAVAGTVAAVGAALVTLTMQTAEQANEITRLSAVAGMSTDAFQEMAVGAKAFGIEQDALADILKDTQEKFGEMIAIEGGGAIDFFEQIADKVNITAEQFRSLGGADALQLYIGGLEKAGVSQNEMIAYMEMIASESSRLIPLLRNDGEAMKFFAEEARKAGAILDEETIRSANEMEAAGYMLELQMDGLKNQIAKELMPKLAGLSSDLLGLANDTGAAEGAADLLVDGLRGVIKIAIGASGAVNLLGKTIGGMAAAASSAFDGITWSDWMTPGSKGVLEKIAQNKSKVHDALDAYKTDIQLEIDKIAKSLATVDGKSDADRAEELKKYADFLQQRNAIDEQMRRGSGKSGSLGKKAADEAQKKTDALKSQIESERKARQSQFEQVAGLSRSAVEIAQDEYAQRMALIGEFANKSNGEYTRMADWAMAEKKRSIAGIALDEIAWLEQYRQPLRDQIDQIKSRYTMEREEIQRTSTMRAEAKAQAIDLINKAEQKELAEYQDQQTQKTEDLRASLDERYRIELAYQRQIKEIVDSGMSDADAARFMDVAGVNKDKANAAYDKPLTDISNRMYGMTTDDKLSQLNAQYEQERDIILEHTEGNEIARQELLSKLQDEFHQAQMMTTLAYGSDIAGNMASILKDMGQEQSKAYKVMFAVSKAFAIADAGVKIMQGIAAAASLPFPANIPAMATVAAATAGLVGTIQSIRMVGQAHDGIMSVPESGTWNLQRGERVLPQDTAQRLDNTLERINTSGQSASGINVEINNYGSSKAFEVQQIDENHVRIIARDEVARGAGRAAAADMSNPNSDMSKAMQRNLMVERRR
jgi:hypothetical protein